MDKLKEQAVLTIVELLKKEQATERAKEYENQLLEMLEEQDRKEIAEVLAGSKLPSLLSDTIAKRIFSADSHRERLAYLLKNVVQDDSIEVEGSYTNEGLMQSRNSKKVIFDEPAKLKDGRHSDTEFQISLQEYIFRRAELYASDMLMFSYSVEEGQKKSEVSYSNTAGVLLVVLMKNSSKEFKKFNETSERYIQCERCVNDCHNNGHACDFDKVFHNLLLCRSCGSFYFSSPSIRLWACFTLSSTRVMRSPCASSILLNSRCSSSISSTRRFTYDISVLSSPSSCPFFFASVLRAIKNEAIVSPAVTIGNTIASIVKPSITPSPPVLR